MKELPQLLLRVQLTPQEAERIYEQSWLHWLLSRQTVHVNLAAQKTFPLCFSHEVIMNEMQVVIQGGSDDRWKEFVKGVPGLGSYANQLLSLMISTPHIGK